MITLKSAIIQTKNLHEQIPLKNILKVLEIFLGNSSLLIHPHRVFRKFVLHHKCFETCVRNSRKHVWRSYCRLATFTEFFQRPWPYIHQANLQIRFSKKVFYRRTNNWTPVFLISFYKLHLHPGS